MPWGCRCTSGGWYPGPPSLGTSAAEPSSKPASQISVVRYKLKRLRGSRAKYSQCQLAAGGSESLLLPHGTAWSRGTLQPTRTPGDYCPPQVSSPSPSLLVILIVSERCLPDGFCGPSYSEGPVVPFNSGVVLLPVLDTFSPLIFLILPHFASFQ